MNDTKQQIEDLTTKLTKMQSELDSLSQAFYKNNFSSSQSFTKDVVFQTRMKVPHYTSAPAVCEVGDLIEIAGKLYICTVANTTFTLVGTQS